MLAYLRYLFINKGKSPRIAAEFIRVSEEVLDGNSVYVGENEPVQIGRPEEDMDVIQPTTFSLKDLMKKQNYIGGQTRD